MSRAEDLSQSEYASYQVRVPEMTEHQATEAFDQLNRQGFSVSITGPSGWSMPTELEKKTKEQRAKEQRAKKAEAKKAKRKRTKARIMKPGMVTREVTIDQIRAVYDEIESGGERKTVCYEHSLQVGVSSQHMRYALKVYTECLEEGRFGDPATANLTTEQIRKLKEFALNIRDNYDCDTGANGVHDLHCRACVAADVLGLPPHEAADPRTRGG